MRFKCRFLKKKFLLLLITLGIGSALYANDELKSLADSLRRMIDEKPLFIQQKEQRINRIKCLLKGSGLTLEQKYKINFQLCNEYKKFVVDSAIHYVDQNLEIARKLNNRDLKNQSSLQLSLLYSMCGRYRDAELILEKIKTSELSKDLLSVYYETYSRFWEWARFHKSENSPSGIIRYGGSGDASLCHDYSCVCILLLASEKNG